MMPRRFLAAEAQGGADQTVDEPFESDRYLNELTADPGDHPVDDRRADHRLAHGDAGRPGRAVGVEIFDGHGQIVVRIQQPFVRGDYAVSVGVGVVAGGDLVALPVAEHRSDEPSHRIR